MTKDEAVQYMVKKIEDIERDRIASPMSIEPNQKKKEVVDLIIKALKEVNLDHEDK